jgi:hypothetical protein
LAVAEESSRIETVVLFELEDVDAVTKFPLVKFCPCAVNGRERDRKSAAAHGRSLVFIYFRRGKVR